MSDALVFGLFCLMVMAIVAVSAVKETRTTTDLSAAIEACEHACEGPPVEVATDACRCEEGK